MTDGHSALVFGAQHQILMLTVASLLMCGALCDKRMDLSFATTVGSRRRSYSWARVQRDSRPYFTASDSKFHQPGGPIISRALGFLFVASYDSLVFQPPLPLTLAAGPPYTASARTAKTFLPLFRVLLLLGTTSVV
jgi:hypothetical protein